MRTLRGAFFCLCFLIWTALLVPPYLLIFFMGRRIRRPFVGLWHRGACVMTGLRIKKHGTPCPSEKVLLAGNHVSYLDIPVIASCMDVTFVAKADVADWPFFGFLAKIAQTAFIERKPTKAREQKEQLTRRLNDGERIMIFPEGTSSNGEKVLPFKSSLFELALNADIKEDVWVQPVTISFSRHKDGRPLERREQDQFTWYGDMSLLPHLWNVFCIKGCEVDVVFHPPQDPLAFAGRKELCQWAENAVVEGLNEVKARGLVHSASYHERLMREHGRPGCARSAWLDKELNQLFQSILPLIRHPLERRRPSQH